MRSALSQLPGFYGEPVYLDVAHFGSAGLAGRVPGARQREIAGPGDLGDVVRGHRLVIGHYAAASLLDAGCTGLAVQVREPRSRVLSLYRFWQENPAEERAGWGPWGSDLVALADRPLGEFLRSGTRPASARPGGAGGSRPTPATRSYATPSGSWRGAVTRRTFWPGCAGSSV